jgi:hypothetical protein
VKSCPESRDPLTPCPGQPFTVYNGSEREIFQEICAVCLARCPASHCLRTNQTRSLGTRSPSIHGLCPASNNGPSGRRGCSRRSSSCCLRHGWMSCPGKRWRRRRNGRIGHGRSVGDVILRSRSNWRRGIGSPLASSCAMLRHSPQEQTRGSTDARPFPTLMVDAVAYDSSRERAKQRAGHGVIWATVIVAVPVSRIRITRVSVGRIVRTPSVIE